mmetsp:Transcript_7117/g.20128  ORF Transcript_7117/g.20128 Transcript_7117/m.20128 type:complete len:91 (+) Transcript_7117:68-340(+)
MLAQIPAARQKVVDAVRSPLARCGRARGMRDPARRCRSPVGHRHERHEAERQVVESTTEERATTRAPSHSHGGIEREKTNQSVGMMRLSP